MIKNLRARRMYVRAIQYNGKNAMAVQATHGPRIRTCNFKLEVYLGDGESDEWQTVEVGQWVIRAEETVFVLTDRQVQALYHVN